MPLAFSVQPARADWREVGLTHGSNLQEPVVVVAAYGSLAFDLRPALIV
jgi:hypothetical protein